MIKSLHATGNALANSFRQLEILNEKDALPLFKEKLNQCGIPVLSASGVEILQINVGYMCNQTCKHCHVDAGPDRKEIMTTDTMKKILRILDRSQFSTIDLTGGAPEMNPDFRWFVKEIRERNSQCNIIVRCNLTILKANKKYFDLPVFYREHNVEVVSSLPFYNADRTDRQRGDGVFEDSVAALKMLNAEGYGVEGTGLILNLVYNPSGAFLPASQALLEKEFKQELLTKHGIVFNQLFAITNMPISRFLDYLLQSNNYHSYMNKLLSAFNPSAVANVMCRNTISVGWDGYLYDCDFNQMLGLKTHETTSRHIDDCDLESLNIRQIITDQHCYGCTAGAGSSCGGEVIN
jgi:radical SAM/Cys-rich protein